MCTHIKGGLLVTQLLVLKNKKQIASLELSQDREYVAGRASQCDLFLEDVMFSRQHFKIYYADNAWNIHVLSPHSTILFKDQHTSLFQIHDQESFFIYNYEFVFSSDQEAQQMPQEQAGSPADTVALSHPGTSPDAHEMTSANEDFKENEEKTPPYPQATQNDNDEKTFVPEMSSQEWSVGIPYLITRLPDGATRTLRLDGNYWTLGREESCDIVIEDGKASREHCEILQRGSHYFILDKNSSNGTLLNYKKLSSQIETPLKSGDQIQIGKVIYLFEIRDPLFTEKLSHLPISAQEMMDSEIIPFEPKVVRLDQHKKNKKVNPLFIGAIIIFIGIVYIMFDDSSEKKNMASKSGTAVNTQESKPEDSLSPEQKEYVEKTYNLAKALYTQGKYELALTEIAKVHKLIPQYKDSREIYQYAKNAIDTLMEQKEIEQKEENQRKLAKKVDDIINSCSIAYQRSQSSSALEACLEPAIELDPENTKAQQLRALAERNDEQVEIAKEQRSAYLGRVRARKKIFEQAESLKNQGKTLDAIATYGRHIASNLPDPENLEKKSKDEVKNLQNKIARDIQKLTSDAHEFHGKKDYRNAIKSLEQAIRLNPSDGEVKSLHTQYSKELFAQVKALYGDSVLEENLGNIEAAKEKWKKILDLDMEYGDYYKKAASKLKKY